jgi:hypothetical protein
VSSSSIINFIVSGITGPDGPVGNTGATGGTGATGNTGSTGSYGLYFVSAIPSQNNITLYFSDGSTAEIQGAFKGATTADKTLGVVTGANTGGVNIKGVLYNVSGGTFNFFGICAYGSLVASITGSNNEYISIDSIYYGSDILGNYDPATLAPREVLYVGNTITVHGANLKHRSDLGSFGLCGAFDFIYTEYSAGASADTSNHLNSGSKIFSFGPLSRNSNYDGSTFGILLNVENGGVFNLITPIGIRGITGNFKTNEVISITLAIDSDNVWNFPSNVYFETDENYLSCGKNIIGLLSYDGGTTWLAVPSHRGHGISNIGRQCIPGAAFGSCCYTKADGTKNCIDYTNKEECDLFFGQFYPIQSCAQTCGSDVSVCCTSGKCIEGVSVSECEQFGGDYWEGVTCGYAQGTENYPDPAIYNTPELLRQQGRFCYDPCGTKIMCCKDGQCLGEYSRVQCELILGGRSVQGNSCSEVDCCDYNTINGACCRCTTDPITSIVTSECIGVLSVTDCRDAGGNYMGPGKQCEDVNCNCVCANVVDEDPYGACCRQDADGYCCTPFQTTGGETAYECRASTYFNCEFGTGPKGVWSSTLTECTSICGDGAACSSNPNSVDCCFYDTVYSDTDGDGIDDQVCYLQSGRFCYPSAEMCTQAGGSPPLSSGECNPDRCYTVPGGPDIGGFGGGYGILGNITTASNIIPGTVCLDGVKRSICTAAGGFFSAFSTCDETDCSQVSSCPECAAPKAWVCAGGECVCRIPVVGDVWSTNCSICASCTTSLTQSPLKNLKIYINSSDYICAPSVCTDCTDMELCD